MVISFLGFFLEAERAQRERLRDLAVFERLNRNPSLSSPSLAVKKVSFGFLLFSRILGISVCYKL